MAIDRPLDDDAVREFRDQFAAIIRQTMEQPPSGMAFQCADALIEHVKASCAGQRLCVPAGPKVDGEAIAADWNAGYKLAEVMRRNDCSKSTAYNYHPSRQKERAAASAER